MNRPCSTTEVSKKQDMAQCMEAKGYNDNSGMYYFRMMGIDLRKKQEQ